METIRKSEIARLPASRRGVPAVVVLVTMLSVVITSMWTSPGRLWAQAGTDAKLGQAAGVSYPTVMNELPGYSAFAKISGLRRGVGEAGRVSRIEWSADGKIAAFTNSGKRKTVVLETGVISDYEKFEMADSKGPAVKSLKVAVAPVGRAEQRLWTISPDNRWKAIYKDFNVQLLPVSASEDSSEDEATDEATDVIQVTTDGNVKLRYGTCCWVYGEELDQSDAMWWSPDGKKLAFYRVAESHMKDYNLSVKNVDVYPSLETTRYPTAGEANPHVALMIYDVAAKSTIKVNVDGLEDQYLFDIGFAPDSKSLKFHRTNRWQNQLDVMSADVDSGEVKTIVSETQSTWQNNSPVFDLLEDDRRFIWQTEKSGYRAFELRSIEGERLNPLTMPGDYPVNRIEKLDEEAGWLYYSAFPDSNPYNLQYFRVRLDGTQGTRLTGKSLNHTSLTVSPDHRYFFVTCESPEVAPETTLYSADGNQMAVVATDDSEVAAEYQLTPPELFHFTADDGVTEIWGVLYKPTNFDPNKKYPLLIDVYGGPQSGAFNNRYSAGNAACEFGFVIAKIGNRGTSGRSKAFESATYLKLGGPDLQDQADGVKFLSQRSYVDASRVGIYGHSYGGYMTALALLKFPAVFHVGVSGAPVTHWKNYDTIYTERYMRTPEENPEGYEQGSCMKYADSLKGRLLLVHGLMDDNVHPSNTWQLADALYKAGKRFDMQIYPGFRHGIGSTYSSVRWEYLCRHLLPEAASAEK